MNESGFDTLAIDRGVGHERDQIGDSPDGAFE
jgi:hypothetical protein